MNKKIFLLIVLLGIGKLFSQNNSIPILKACTDKENTRLCSYFSILQLIIDELNRQPQTLGLEGNVKFIISSNLKFNKNGKIITEYSLLHSNYSEINIVLEEFLNNIPEIIPKEEGKQYSRLRFKNTFYISYEENYFKPWDNPPTKESDYSLPEKFAIYPGCKSGWSYKKLQKCFNESLSNYLVTAYNAKEVMRKAKISPGSSVQIIVVFEIDSTGKVDNIYARSKHKALEKEAVRVIKKIRKIKPSHLGDKPIATYYSFPISFRVPY